MDIETLLGKERIEVVADEAEIQTVIRKAKTKTASQIGIVIAEYN